MKLKSLIICLFFPVCVYAQQIYPVPQEIVDKNEVHFVGVNSKNNLFKDYESKKGIKIKEKLNKSLPSEGYVLDVEAKSINICYSTER